MMGFPCIIFHDCRFYFHYKNLELQFNITDDDWIEYIVSSHEFDKLCIKTAPSGVLSPFFMWESFLTVAVINRRNYCHLSHTFIMRKT